MFTLILNYTKPIEDVDKVRPAHVEFVTKYFEQGIFIACGRQEPNKQGVVEGGLIWAQGVTGNQIESITQEDPYIIENLAEYKIIEFKPQKCNDALADFA